MGASSVSRLPAARLDPRTAHRRARPRRCSAAGPGWRGSIGALLPALLLPVTARVENRIAVAQLLPPLDLPLATRFHHGGPRVVSGCHGCPKAHRVQGDEGTDGQHHRRDSREADGHGGLWESPLRLSCESHCSAPFDVAGTARRVLRRASVQCGRSEIPRLPSLRRASPTSNPGSPLPNPGGCASGPGQRRSRAASRSPASDRSW